MLAPSRRRLLLAALPVAFAFLAGASGAATHISGIAGGDDSIDTLADACAKEDASSVKRILAAHPNLVNAQAASGQTPLLLAVGAGSAEIVRFLLDSEAKPDAPAADKRTPLLVSIALVAGDTKTSSEGAVALLERVKVTLQSNGLALGDILRRMLADAAVPADVAAGLSAPITVTLTGGMDTALLFLRRLARRAGQPFAITIEGGHLKVAPASDAATPAGDATGTGTTSATLVAEGWPVLTTNPRFRFHRLMSRAVTEAYLSRCVSHNGLCACWPETPTPYFEDDLRMLVNIGAKYVTNAAYIWGVPTIDGGRFGEAEDAHFRMATERAARVHAADPEVVLQGCVYEITMTRMNGVPVPSWVFDEFHLPVAARNFDYAATLYPDGDLVNHWEAGASVPDMSRRETRLWFFYRAVRYIDAGFESLHFGQVHLMDHKDSSYDHWWDLLTRVRRYAAQHARRRFVLIDTNTHGISRPDGRLLFDYHSYPMRIQEGTPTTDNPQPGKLVANVADAIYGHSKGGITPSGWSCDSGLYMVGFDNTGVSSKPGQAGQGVPWVWGYDEICWFTRQSQAVRNAFLNNTRAWLQARSEGGFFNPATRKVLAVPATVAGQSTSMYDGNRPSTTCPLGFGQEDAIKAMWAAS